MAENPPTPPTTQPSNLGALLPTVATTANTILRRPGTPPQYVPLGAPQYSGMDGDTRRTPITKIGYSSWTVIWEAAEPAGAVKHIPLGGKAVLFQSLLFDLKSGKQISPGSTGRQIYEIGFDHQPGIIQLDNAGQTVEQNVAPFNFWPYRQVEKFLNGFAFGSIQIFNSLGGAISLLRVVTFEEPLGIAWGAGGAYPNMDGIDSQLLSPQPVAAEGITVDAP